jgi:hypothetical protein
MYKYGVKYARTTHKVLCMGSEDGKMVNRVSKGHGRFSGIFAVAVLVVLLAAIPSVSLTAIAFSDSNAQTEPRWQG